MKDYVRFEGTMNPTQKQIEFSVDVLKSIGLAALIGCVADAFVDGSRQLQDIIGAALSFIALVTAYRLTRKLNGGKL